MCIGELCWRQHRNTTQLAQDRIYTLHVADIDYLDTSGRNGALASKVEDSPESIAEFATQSVKLTVCPLALLLFYSLVVTKEDCLAFASHLDFPLGWLKLL